MREMDPSQIEKRNHPLSEAIHDEREPSHEKKLEILYPHAKEIVKAYRHKVVPRVEAALGKYGSYARFPEDVVQELANKVYSSGETEMIEAIAMALQDKKED